jgi:hypothetical protein
VQLVISDAHTGLKQAIGAVMAGASWQRCRVHFLRNVLARVPKGSAEMVAAAIRTVFAQPTAAEVTDQVDKGPAQSVAVRCAGLAQADLALSCASLRGAHLDRAGGPDPSQGGADPASLRSGLSSGRQGTPTPWPRSPVTSGLAGRP